MNRQLPKEHPIYDLLKPHLVGTGFINDKAQDTLMVNGGPIDELQANDVADSLKLVRIETQKRIQKDFSPEADFKNRGVTKDDFPGLYMYRDVGMQYWEATHTWVTEYLNLYYSSDQDMI
ncbi:lipoxygenase family protein, partial [Salmonella sp. s58408]|uniref:lipoxygenase family protein n=1 Tax=Salmonella sp. s58408 TaxID=3159701 RepID=UPI0039811CDB